MTDGDVSCLSPECERSFGSDKAMKGHLTAHDTGDIVHSEMREFLDEHDHVPTKSEFVEYSSFSSQPIHTHFDDYKGLLGEFGCDLPPKISDQELLAELQRLDKEHGNAHGESVTQHGKYSRETYRQRFGSFDDALEAAGLETFDREGTRISDDRLIEYLHEFADDLDRQPTADQMDENGRYDRKTYSRRFGSWNDALREAGFEPSQPAHLVKGENHPRWSDESNDGNHYYGANWSEQREKSLERDGHECQVCQNDGSEHTLDVHHIRPVVEFYENGDPDFGEMNALSNLVVLCRSCHRDVEDDVDPAELEVFVERACEHVF
jgi:hypothetical protein